MSTPSIKLLRPVIHAFNAYMDNCDHAWDTHGIHTHTEMMTCWCWWMVAIIRSLGGILLVSFLHARAGIPSICLNKDWYASLVSRGLGPMYTLWTGVSGLSVIPHTWHAHVAWDCPVQIYDTWKLILYEIPYRMQIWHVMMWCIDI